MDGFRERQDGFMRVCETLLRQPPCWHSLFSAGIAVVMAAIPLQPDFLSTAGMAVVMVE